MNYYQNPPPREKTAEDTKMKEEKEKEDKEKEENVEEQQNTADASKTKACEKADDAEEKKDEVKKTEVGRGIKKKGPLLCGMDGGSFKKRREAARQAVVEEPGHWGSPSKQAQTKEIDSNFQTANTHSQFNLVSIVPFRPVSYFPGG